MSETPKNIGNHATTLKTFLIRLINGEFGLARTYWLFGVVGVFALLIASLLVSSVISYIFEPLGTILFLISVFVTFAYGIAAMIGAWRAASQYEGPKHWALLTKLAIAVGALPVVLFILFFVLSVVSFFLQPFMMRDMPTEPPESIMYESGEVPVPVGQRVALTPLQRINNPLSVLRTSFPLRGGRNCHTFLCPESEDTKRRTAYVQGIRGMALIPAVDCNITDNV